MTHIRAYRYGRIAVCGEEPGPKGFKGDSNCKVCLMFAGSKPPSNYAELMGYPDNVYDPIQYDDTISNKHEHEMIKEQAKERTKDIDYDEYVAKEKLLHKVRNRAYDPNTIRETPNTEEERSRIVNSAVSFSFGESKIIVSKSNRTQKRLDIN